MVIVVITTTQEICTPKESVLLCPPALHSLCSHSSLPAQPCGLYTGPPLLIPSLCLNLSSLTIFRCLPACYAPLPACRAPALCSDPLCDRFAPSPQWAMLFVLCQFFFFLWRDFSILFYRPGLTVVPLASTECKDAVLWNVPAWEEECLCQISLCPVLSSEFH